MLLSPPDPIISADLGGGKQTRMKERIVAEFGVDGGWKDSAEAWIKLAPSHATRTLLLDPIMLAEAGHVPGLHVLDIGCGEGRFSRLLAARGAITVGLDPIHRLVEAAVEDGDGTQHYLQGVGERLPLRDQSFDIVIAYLALIDIPDFRSAIQEAARVLKRGGRFLIANVSNLASSSADPSYDEEGHFLHYAVDHYLEERAMIVEFGGVRVRNWHRPLSDYIDAYLGTGLILKRYIEPRPDESLRDDPRFESWFRVPTFDVMVWEKP
jgi:SAM-dependent methyltransferase